MINNKMKNTFLLGILVSLTALFAACSNHDTSEQNNQTTTTTVALDSTITLAINPIQLDSIVNTVIAISANDFHKNQQPAPLHFKNVKLKYMKKQDGEELYILCGEFSTNSETSVPFATIKNSDYEQWIGNSALTYCEQSKAITYTKKDLSTELENYVKHLQANQK